MMPSLLAADEPPAFTLENAQGSSPFFIICDHAGALLPRALGDLGVSSVDRTRHIAWDIGAAAVAKLLAVALDACVILQNYSRLVIDCNRPLSAPGSIVTLSESTPIPGNEALSADERAQRAAEIFVPYHDRIEALLAARQTRRQPTLLVSMHSFTPVFLAQARAWHVGILYNRDVRLAQPLLRHLRSEPHLVVGDNEPYAVDDATDYAIPIHGERRGIAHVEIEIRQDLITHPAGQREWAERFARTLPAAAADMTG